jgi:hypothetical protein
MSHSYPCLILILIFLLVWLASTINVYEPKEEE